MVDTPEGPVDSSDLDEHQVQELFTLMLVGSENLEKEVGSNLATMTSIAALATTAGVVRAQGPRLLRGPVALLGVSSGLAWRISRRRRGRRLRILEGALVVIIGLLGLVGTVIDLYGRRPRRLPVRGLGVPRPRSGAGGVRGAVVAPLRRPALMGRQKPH